MQEDCLNTHKFPFNFPSNNPFLCDGVSMLTFDLCMIIIFYTCINVLIFGFSYRPIGQEKSHQISLLGAGTLVYKVNGSMRLCVGYIM